jgi:4-hydroxy-2-oxoheptanedioate aldolase
MNNIEKRMTEILKVLKESYGVTAVKSSFETEDLQSFEFLRTKEIASSADVELLVKLGGGEALTDARQAKVFGARYILAPMIESRFAVEKFLEMCEKVFSREEETKFLINTETVDGYEKIEDILSASNINLLDAVVLGRTDLCSALNTKDVESQQVFDIAKDLFEKVKKTSVRCIVGGGITPKSARFLEDLGDRVDGYETRKVVFGDYRKANGNVEDGIRLALEFELCWYKLKQEYYSKRAKEDTGKIKELAAVLGIES